MAAKRAAKDAANVHADHHTEKKKGQQRKGKLEKGQECVTRVEGHIDKEVFGAVEKAWKRGTASRRKDSFDNSFRHSKV